MSTKSQTVPCQLTGNTTGRAGEGTKTAWWKWELYPVFPDAYDRCGSGSVRGAHTPSGKAALLSG